MTLLSGNHNSIYLDTTGPKLLPDQPRPLCTLSKDVGPCSNRRALVEMPNDVTYCQQLPTVQAGGGAAAIALSYQMAEVIWLVNALDNNNNMANRILVAGLWNHPLQNRLVWHSSNRHHQSVARWLEVCRMTVRPVRPALWQTFAWRRKFIDV